MPTGWRGKDRKPLLTSVNNPASFCFQQNMGNKWSSAASHSWTGMEGMEAVRYSISPGTGEEKAKKGGL